MRCSLFALLLATGWAKVVERDGDAHVTNNGINNGPYQLINCFEASSFRSCLKMNALMVLEDQTSKGFPISILGGSVTLVRNQGEPEGGRELPESVEELNSTLPADAGSREEALNRLVVLAVRRFVRSRALQVRLSDVLDNHWNIVEEGRKKKGGGSGWAFVMAGGMMAALGLGGIAMLAGKALMVAMMALMLSTLAALRGGGKGGGGGHSDHAATTYEVINVPTAHGHHGRSLMGPRGLWGPKGPGGPGLPQEDGATLAYRAHVGTTIDTAGTTGAETGMKGH